MNLPENLSESLSESGRESLIVAVETRDLGPAPKTAKPLPERLIAGDPTFRTWPADVSRGGQVHTGVWEATPGETRSIKGESLEFCHILEGVVEIAEDGGPTRRFRAGDSFVMKPGFTGVWRTLETVRKIYVTVY